MAGARTRRIGLIAGLGLAIGLQLLPRPEALTPEAWMLASLALMMASWWATEAIPIAATALVPLALFPLVGIASAGAAASPYASTTVMLLLGGFIVAMAIERWKLHARIALHVVLAFGGRPAMTVAGFMTAAALLSMWISNTATTLMMIPIALKVADELMREGRAKPAFAAALALGVAYAASIGGIATPVGTPTNLIALEFMSRELDIERMSFPEWMAIGVPAALLVIPAGWVVLTKWAFDIEPAKDASEHGGHDAVRAELDRLGPITAPELRVALLFGAVAALWMFRPVINGWLGGMADRFDWPLTIAFSDMQVAVLGALLSFLIPAGGKTGAGRALMDWETAAKLPWNVVILFGGGISLASALSSTGLAAWLGDQMGFAAAWPVPLLILALVVFVIFLTELTSNVATISAFLPVMAALAVGAGGSGDPLPPELLIIPVSLAASCAFMLPVATAPNAIVYASGRVDQADMIRAGFRLNLLAAILIAGLGALLGPVLF